MEVQILKRMESLIKKKLSINQIAKIIGNKMTPAELVTYYYKIKKGKINL